MPIKKVITNDDIFEEIRIIRNILTGNGDPKNGLVYKVEKNTDAINSIKTNCLNIQQQKERKEMQKIELDAIKRIKENGSLTKDEQDKKIKNEERKLKIKEMQNKAVLWLIRLAVFYVAGDTAYKEFLK